jgi:hypothetical protein
MAKNTTKTVAKSVQAAENAKQLVKSAKEAVKAQKAKTAATTAAENLRIQTEADLGTMFQGITDTTVRAAIKKILAFRGITKGASAPMATSDLANLEAFCGKNRGPKITNAIGSVLEDAQFVLENGFGKATDDVFALQAMVSECEKAIARKPKLKPAADRVQQPAAVKAKATFMAPKLKSAKAPVAPPVKRSISAV